MCVQCWYQHTDRSLALLASAFTLSSDDAQALLILYDADRSGTIERSELAAIVDDLEAIKAKQEAGLLLEA